MELADLLDDDRFEEKVICYKRAVEEKQEIPEFWKIQPDLGIGIVPTQKRERNPFPFQPQTTQGGR